MSEQQASLDEAAQQLPGGEVKRRPHRGTGRRLDIRVEEDVITASMQRDSSHCMIADAIRAHIPDAAGVMVDLQTIRFTDTKKGLRYTWLTPPMAQKALINFDQGLPVDPFEFSSPKPVQVREAAKKTPSRKRKPGEPPLPRKVQPSQGRTAVVGGDRGDGGAAGRPVLVGGRPLPANVVLSYAPRQGRVREFGLRQLKP